MKIIYFRIQKKVKSVEQRKSLKKTREQIKNTIEEEEGTMQGYHKGAGLEKGRF